MVCMRNLALAASTLITFSAAAPTIENRQTWTPGTQNNTQEFIIHMTVTDGNTKYTQYALEAYHTGAGLADPVFVNTTGTRAFLNGTNLQFDNSAYPFAAIANAGDSNYARWEPVSMGSGYGTPGWVNNGPDGIEIDSEEFGGWIVCEWFHDINAPQLFQLIKGFATDPYDIPSSCARVLLFPTFI